MPKAGRTLVKEAIQDANAVKKLAMQKAKQALIEELSPGLKRVVERTIRGATEDVDRVRRAKDGYGENEKWEEGVQLEGDKDMAKDKDDMDYGEKDESLSAMFPDISEMGHEDEEEMPEGGLYANKGYEDEGEEEMEMAIPTLDEMGAEHGEPGEEGDMDEEIEISEDELKKAYESLRRTDAALKEASVDWSPTVVKDFPDTYQGTKGDWAAEGDPKPAGGLADVDGEKPWEEQEPSSKQDYQVKEAIEKGLKENATLRQYVSYLEEELDKAVGLVKKLHKEVSEVNLFNTKVMHVNELLNKYGRSLTRNQKKLSLESIDQARTVREVRVVAGTLNASLGSLIEVARGPKPNGQRARTSGTVTPKVLSESADATASDPQYSRMRKLAGLLK